MSQILHDDIGEYELEIACVRGRMTCRGSGYIICRCYGDVPLERVCGRCGGDGPCQGCEDEALSDEQLIEEAEAAGVNVPAEAERVRQTLLAAVEAHRAKSGQESAED
ncbi:MAG TPA: hypothetical protein VFB99_20470 [Vicinamibacterales bacterium]|nr:hypothetical protein [Vicinamibacterales bacterium]